MKRCEKTCSDPVCKRVGCLNQPAWKFRQQISDGHARQAQRNRLGLVSREGAVERIGEFAPLGDRHGCKGAR